MTPTEGDFDSLFDDVYPSLYRYCHRMAGDADLAEDTAQEAFVRLLERKVRGERRGLEAWLFKVARHLLRDRARVGDNRRRLLAERPLDNPVNPRGEDDPATALERGRARAVVRRILEELPERDRTLLLLREEGFAYRELAREVGVAPGSVGTLLARARRRFEEALREHGGFEHGEVDEPS